MISKCTYFRTVSSFSYDLILPNLLFGHLQIKINVIKDNGDYYYYFLDCETILDKPNSVKNMSNGEIAMIFLM